MTTSISIRPAGPDDHDVLADAFYKMCIANGYTDDDFYSGWKDITRAFIADAKRQSQGCAFVADTGDTIVGTALCQTSRKLYPPALKANVRKDGYIWGVYVAPLHRRRGLATRLTEACVTYLDRIGCTRVVLHASPTGKPVYAALGFNETNEMRRELAA